MPEKIGNDPVASVHQSEYGSQAESGHLESTTPFHQPVESMAENWTLRVTVRPDSDQIDRMNREFRRLEFEVEVRNFLKFSLPVHETI